MASEMTESLADWPGMQKYVVSLVDAAEALPSSGEQRSVLMTTRKGSKFLCTLPTEDAGADSPPAQTRGEGVAPGPGAATALTGWLLRDSGLDSTSLAMFCCR
jgi:hypothetical protein